jgi:hypothetical protein
MQWIEEGIKLPEEYRTEDPLTTVAYNTILLQESKRALYRANLSHRHYHM